jgi:carbon-monoxide dehydrogenase medium subunit
MWNELLVATTEKDILDWLDEGKGRSRILAGGTDLLLQQHRYGDSVDSLISITEVESLQRIEVIDGWLNIGAAVSFTQVIESPLSAQSAPLLVEACSAIGSPQIRNQGTVVGNVVNAAPAADALVALFALEAELVVVATNGERRIPIAETCCGVQLSTIDSTYELVRAVSIPVPPSGCGTAFVRISQRKAFCLPTLVGAFKLVVEQGLITQALVVLGPVGPTPCRIPTTEEFLMGREAKPELIDQAAAAAVEEANPRDSHARGSGSDRKDMVFGLVRRGLSIALDRAGEPAVTK